MHRERYLAARAPDALRGNGGRLILLRNRVALLGLAITFTLVVFTAGYWFARLPKRSVAPTGPAARAAAIASWLQTQQIVKCVPALLNLDMFVPESTAASGFGPAPSPSPMLSNQLYADSDNTLRLVGGGSEPTALVNNLVYVKVFPLLNMPRADWMAYADRMFAVWDGQSHVFAVSHPAYEMEEDLVLVADSRPPSFVPDGEAGGVVLNDGLGIGSTRKDVENEMGYVGPAGSNGLAISGPDPNIKTTTACGFLVQRFQRADPAPITFTFVYRNDMVVAFDYRYVL